jgi:membrane protein DedA with SNARE-associated domain
MTKSDDKFGYMRAYAKYLGLITRMIILVLVGGFGGKAIDNYFHFETHIVTIILIILATILSLYLLFKTMLDK